MSRQLNTLHHSWEQRDQTLLLFRLTKEFKYNCFEETYQKWNLTWNFETKINNGVAWRTQKQCTYRKWISDKEVFKEKSLTKTNRVGSNEQNVQSTKSNHSWYLCNKHSGNKMYKPEPC
jgi:hypothetical protein